MSLPLQTIQENRMKEFEKKIPKKGLELYGVISTPHSHDLIVECPYCHRIIKGYGSMRGHIRWKHLPKHYGEVYCIRDKKRMGWYDARKYKICMKCFLKINILGIIVEFPRGITEYR